jgi:hypothetical protein
MFAPAGPGGAAGVCLVLLLSEHRRPKGRHGAGRAEPGAGAGSGAESGAGAGAGNGVSVSSGAATAVAAAAAGEATAGSASEDGGGSGDAVEADVAAAAAAAAAVATEVATAAMAAGTVATVEETSAAATAATAEATMGSAAAGAAAVAADEMLPTHLDIFYDLQRPSHTERASDPFDTAVGHTTTHRPQAQHQLRHANQLWQQRRRHDQAPQPPPPPQQQYQCYPRNRYASSSLVGRCRLTPECPRVDRAWLQRLRPKYDAPLSKFALKSNLRRYTLAPTYRISLDGAAQAILGRSARLVEPHPGASAASFFSFAAAAAASVGRCRLTISNPR